MRVIEASSTYLSTNNLTPYEFIEKAGRTCYKSDPVNNAAEFVKKMVNNNHTAMLEHAHIYMKLTEITFNSLHKALDELKYSYENSKDIISPFLNITEVMDDRLTTHYFVSGSFRTFINMFTSECKIYFEDLTNIYTILHDKYPEVFIEPTECASILDVILTRDEFIDTVSNLKLDKEEIDIILSKHLTHTVLFVCDRGVTHEFVRHRPASFAQESTRYCNYSKDKFGNEITVIRPVFFEEGSEEYKIWYDGCLAAEKAYFALLDQKCVAQQARDNLPTSVKTEIIITTTEVEWQHIINLRYHGTTGSPHPQMVQSMSLIYDELVAQSSNRLK